MSVPIPDLSYSTGPALSTLNDRSVISVQAPEINIGEILRPMTEGSFSNGGYPIVQQSRYARSGGSSIGALDFSVSSQAPVLILGIAAVGGVLWLLLRR